MLCAPLIPKKGANYCVIGFCLLSLNWIISLSLRNAPQPTTTGLRRYSTHWMFHGLMDIQRAATTRPKCLNVFALASVISIVLEIESCIVLPKENVPALCSAGTFSLGLFFSTPTIDVEPLYSLTHPVKYRKIGDRHYRKRQVNPC